LNKQDEEQVQLLHPEGKHGAKILKRRCASIRKAVLDVVGASVESSFMERAERAPKRISHFDGKTTWYITAVKLDPETRGELERFERNGRQHIRRT